MVLALENGKTFSYTYYLCVQVGVARKTAKDAKFWQKDGFARAGTSEGFWRQQPQVAILSVGKGNEYICQGKLWRASPAGTSLTDVR